MSRPIAARPAAVTPIERIGSAIGRRGLLDVAAIRRVESALLAGVPPFTLMAAAGEATARLALALAPHARRTVVFAGPGNNGGDGIEAATRLREFGRDVVVVLVAEVTRLPADATRALERARQCGVEVIAFDGVAAERAGDADLVIDALLGIGASRPPEGAISAAIECIERLSDDGARVLAVDVPSGLDADRGTRLGGACVRAHDTISLIALKPGLFTADGRDHAGSVWLATLADAAADAAGAAAIAWLVGTGDATCFAAPRRHAAHKGSFGDVAVVGGAAGMEGAAWLAARAAHAAGAGRVFVDLLAHAEGGGEAAPGLDAFRPELMQRPGWWRGPAGTLGEATVVCGCGGGDAVRAALPRLLSSSRRLVLDADALNAVAVDTSMQSLLAARRGRDLATVLTPHPLEAARLLGIATRQVQADRLAAAQGLAERFGATVVLKGSGTVTASPGDVPRINATGNAGLATAGSGDVLAGWIGGLWRDGVVPFDVATRAVVEHGAAAEPQRPGVVRADDLVEALYRRSRGG
ncbi:MAG: NAD(P)H-hydrate dehydratase [Caldimonas sp.]